jgi:hypothetical protein
MVSEWSFRSFRETVSVFGYSTVQSRGWFTPNSPLMNWMTATLDSRINRLTV